MTNLTVETEGFADGGLIPNRQLTINGTTVRSPTKAVPARKFRDDEAIDADSYEVCELHRTIDTERLTTERRGKTTPITDHLQNGANKASEDNVVIVFLTYEEASELTQVEAEQIVDIQAEFSDIITVPLMPDLTKVIDESQGVSAPAYQTYRSNAELITDTARERYPEMPVMGTFPILGREFVSDLLSHYLEEGLRAFCTNFNRGRPSASTKVETIKPLMQDLARRGLHEATFHYAINLKNRPTNDTLGGKPADATTAFGMGFDIVGENHVPFRAPPEEVDWGDDGEQETFSLFDRHQFVYRDIPLEDLKREFPERSAFDPEHVVERARESDKHRRRLEKLVATEQMEIATRELRKHLTSDEDAFEYLTTKPGVLPQSVRAVAEVGEAFEGGIKQTDLDDF